MKRLLRFLTLLLTALLLLLYSSIAVFSDGDKIVRERDLSFMETDFGLPEEYVRTDTTLQYMHKIMLPIHFPDQVERAYELNQPNQGCWFGPEDIRGFDDYEKELNDAFENCKAILIIDPDITKQVEYVSSVSEEDGMTMTYAIVKRVLKNQMDVEIKEGDGIWF